MQSVLAVVLCWAQLAAVLASGGLVLACVDASGQSHVEIGGDADCSAGSASLDDACCQPSSRAAGGAACQCGPCTHLPISPVLAIMHSNASRPDPCLTQVRAASVHDVIAAETPRAQARNVGRTFRLGRVPLDRARVLRSVILIV